MKTKLIGITLIAIGLLAGCGGSGSSPGSKPLASITINASNADSVAKGAVSSQTVADSGSASANNSKATSQLLNGSTKNSALSIALDNIKMAESLFAPSTKATRTVASTKVDCLSGNLAPNATTNYVTYANNDPDNSGDLSVGDTISATYTACTLGTTTIRVAGVSYLTFNTYHHTATPSPADPNSASTTLGYTNLTITDTTPGTGVTVGFDGSMTMGYTYNGTLLSASMTGSSFTTSVTGLGSVTYTNFNITSTANANDFTFYADMSISMTPTGGSTGTVNISTPVTFTGPLGGNPIAGQMRIDGANGSYMTITANNDNTVTIVIFNGTNFEPTSTPKPWDQI